MEQPVPRVHRLRRHLRSGPDDPRRRPVDHADVRQRRASARAPSISSPWPGPPIAITDQVDTIGDNAHVFQNREVLALRKAGLVGKPVFNNSHGFEYDPTSRDPERWIGQLPDGSWVVACSTGRTARHRTKSIDFADVLGFTGPAAVRDLWAHQDLGSMTSYQVSLGAPRLGAPVGRARRARPISRPTSGPGPDRPGSRTPSAATKAWATSPVSTPREAAWPWPSRRPEPAVADSQCRVANSTGSPVDADRARARPGDRPRPRQPPRSPCRARRPGPRGGPCRSR